MQRSRGAGEGAGRPTQRLVRSPLPVVRDSSALSGRARRLELEELGLQEEKERLLGSKKSYCIPAPLVVRTESGEVYAGLGILGDFVPSTAYIQVPSDDSTIEGVGDDVEYELTQEDMEWLRLHPKYGPQGMASLDPDTLEAMLNIFEGATGFSVVVTPSDVELAMYQQLGISRNPQNRVIDHVHAYWLMRRKRLRKPLSRQFWPIPSGDDTNPELTFRPRVKERYRLRNSTPPMKKKGESVAMKRSPKSNKATRSATKLIASAIAEEKAEEMMIPDPIPADLLDDESQLWIHEVDDYLNDSMVFAIDQGSFRVTPSLTRNDLVVHHRRRLGRGGRIIIERYYAPNHHEIYFGKRPTELTNEELNSMCTLSPKARQRIDEIFNEDDDENVSRAGFTSFRGRGIDV